MTPAPTTRVSSNPREALAVLSYAGFLAVAAAASLWMLADLWSGSREVEAAQDTFDRLAARSTLRPAGSSSPSPRERGSPFLVAPTLTVAGAGLEQRVASIVTKAGGTMISSQVELDGPEAKNGFVTVTATLEVPQPGLQLIFYDIEAGTPYLFVDKISIRSPEDLGDPEHGLMRMTMSVTGQWRPTE